MTLSANDAMIEARARIDQLAAHLEATGKVKVRLIETHISWVLLARDHVYKLKKPVKLPFLDFSSLDARRHFSAEEVRLNSRLAPELYEGVIDVHAGAHGASFDAIGPVVEVAVKMRRFPDGALWSERLAGNALVADDIDAMALRISRFHEQCAIASSDSVFARCDAIEHMVDGLVTGIDGWQQTLPSAGADGDWPALRRWLQSTVRQLSGFWEARRAAGRVRECHGDLHLRNVVQLDSGPTAFDGIEFDRALRWIDVSNDMAFLAMDLLASRRPDLAWRFVNAWLEASGDYECLPGLRFYLVCRALVRAHVTIISGNQGRRAEPGHAATDYLALAKGLSRDRHPAVALMHGLPGSGKTFVSQQIIGVAKAIRVRSDVERKRLHGLTALESSFEGGTSTLYSAQATADTYQRLEAIVGLAVRSGWPVVVDAAFLKRAERERFGRVAEALGVRAVAFDCQAPLAILRERVAMRQASRADASEADLQVLATLGNHAEALSPCETVRTIAIDTTVPIDAAALTASWIGESPLRLAG